MLPDWITSHARVSLLKWKVIELFHQVASSYAKFIGTNEWFYTGNRFNSYKIGLGHQHGCRFTVLGQMPSTWRKWRHVKKALFTNFAETTMHLNSPLPPFPPPPKKKIHNHCFHFLLGITVVPRQIEGNVHAKFWGGKQGAVWSQWKWSIASRLFLVQMLLNWYFNHTVKVLNTKHFVFSLCAGVSITCPWARWWFSVDLMLSNRPIRVIIFRRGVGCRY